MAQNTIVTDIEFNISKALKSIQTLRASLNGKIDILGTGAVEKAESGLHQIEQQILKLQQKAPGVGATAQEFDKFYKETLKVTNGMDKLLGEFQGFQITDDYLKENISALQQLSQKALEASKRTKELKENIASTPVSSYETKGQKQKSQQTERQMREYALQGKAEEIKKVYADRGAEYKTLISEAKSAGDSERVKILIRDRNQLIAAEQRYLALTRQLTAATQEEGVQATNLRTALDNAFDPATQELNELNNGLAQVSNNLHQTQNRTYQANQEMLQIEKSAKAFGQLSDQIARLFSATSIFYALRRVVRGAIQDFQELDKQFNEIAIVSEYSTAEMWQSFSTVNKTAQEFGVTTKNVLEVQNLYYHQGKDMAEVNKLTAQTLTLAKITGMDYERATSDLTAALNAYRIAAEDAVRVTDTIAAMDTNAAISSEELMTALTKTASIAANAGMSLESTEVFLTKMIETTREAPENLGTALKTIIARFGEVKQEIDGEEIELADVNRVDTALKSIGISLLDTAGQIRDLDEVFMELSSKWDDLDRNTQRYIATISAGSRQQSRFIAMMENYERTLELTEIAQNSAGLGAKQLAKAQESIETSVNRLKSSWQEFYQNIIKSSAIKTVLDTANTFLSILNALPGPLGAVATGVALWALKTKVLDKVLLTHKIITDGLEKGLTQQQIAQNLLTASRRAEKQTLKEYISILQAYRAAKMGANAEDAKDAADPTTLLTQLAENEALDENTRKILKNTSVKIAADAADKDAAIELATETLNQIAENEALEEHTRNLAKDTAELIANTNARAANAGVTEAQTVIETGNNTSKKGGILNALSSFLLNPKVLAVIIAIGVAIAAVTVVYKKFIKASTDDTKQIEKLQKAREKYNKTLDEYKSSIENLEIVKKYANKTFKTAEEAEEEQTAIKELVTMYPYLLEKIDDEGNYHIKNTEAIREEIDAKKELLNEDIKAHNLLRAQQARQGIYADESTRAGKAMSRMVDYYSVLDDDALDRVAESIDRLGNFNTTLFKQFAKDYASGEKTSFSYKDMNNLFGHGMYLDETQFNNLIESYNQNLLKDKSIGEAFKAALDTVGLEDERLVDMWVQLNKQTGNIYNDLLSGIGEEVNEIYVAEAEVFVEGEMRNTDANERVLSALEKAYARTKVKEIEDSKIARERKIEEDAKANKNTYVTVSPSDPNYATELARAEARAYSGAWISNMILNSDEKIEIKATEETEKKIEDLTNELKKDDKIKEANKIFDNFGAETFELGKKDFGIDTGVDIINDFLNEEFTIQQKELDDIRNKIDQTVRDFGNLNSITFDWNWNDIAPSNDQMRVIGEKFTQLGDWGGNKFLEGFQLVATANVDDSVEGLSQKLKNLYLGIDPTSIESIGEALFEMERLGMSTDATQETFQKLIDSAGGLDAFNFGDISTAAEDAEKKIESLGKSIEGLINLTKGAGTISDVGKLFDSITKLAEEKGEDVGKVLAAAREQISYTTEGIQYGGSDSVNAAKRMVDLQKEILMYQMQITEGKIVELQTQLASTKLSAEERALKREELNQLIATQELNRVIYGEYEATKLRALNDSATKNLEDQLEKLERIRDAIKDIVTWLREYDRYADLDAIIEDLENKYDDLEFEIEFSTNADVIGKDLEEQITNLNTQIAANQGGIRAAESEQAMYRDILEKNNSQYVDFDADGNLITNQEELYKLQQEIMRQKKAGNEGAAEALENEYEQIQANIEGYRNAKEKVNDYSKALQENFKALEEFLKANYEAITKIEDKLIEARQAAEDKELEIIKKKYDTIKDENDKYLENIQEMVDKEREIRDRADREQDVKDKEKKLAMMKMDTSGVYASDIRALEQELEGDYRDLEDDAVDKAISDLEKEYQTQAEILDKEVEYLESSLEYRREIMTEYNQWAQEMMMQGSDTVIEYLKANDEEYYTGTAAAQANWTLEWNNAVARGIAANQQMEYSLQPVINNLDACKQNAEGFEGAVEQYSETAIANNGEVSASVEDLTGYYADLVDEVGDLNGALVTLNTAYWNAAKAANELANAQQRVINTKPFDEKIKPIGDNPNKVLNGDNNNDSNGLEPIGDKADSPSIATTIEAYNQPIMASDGTLVVRVYSSLGTNMGEVYLPQDAFKDNKGDLHSYKNKTGKRSYSIQRLGEYSYYKYAKGGYVDYTGPAWVDGTKSRPEYMLNATQTAQFEALVAALSNLYGNGIISLKQSAQKIGDAYYNFHINVEQMANDYDVDQLVSRLEQKMVDSSKYRNITLLKKSQ